MRSAAFFFFFIILMTNIKNILHTLLILLGIKNHRKLFFKVMFYMETSVIKNWAWGFPCLCSYLYCNINVIRGYAFISK